MRRSQDVTMKQEAVTPRMSPKMSTKLATPPKLGTTASVAKKGGVKPATKADPSTPPAPVSSAAAPVADLTVGFPELLSAGSDAGFRDFVADLFAAASGMQAIRRALAKATGLTGSEIAVLLAIRRLSEAGSVSVKAIAEHLHVAGPHATTEIAKLVEAGFVTKQEDASDSRAVDIRLTNEGKRRLEKLTPLVRRVNDVLFEGVTSGEMEHVDRFFKRIIGKSTEAALRLERNPQAGKK